MGAEAGGGPEAAPRGCSELSLVHPRAPCPPPSPVSNADQVGAARSLVSREAGKGAQVWGSGSCPGPVSPEKRFLNKHSFKAKQKPPLSGETVHTPSIHWFEVYGSVPWPRHR